MEKKASDIIESVIMICLVIAVGLFLGRLMNPEFTDGAFQQVKAFQLLPENTAEVMVFGSSHALKGLDTITMYEEYGIGCYNYGGNWQRLNSSLMYLEYALQRQKPKVVLFETFNVNSISENKPMDGEIYYSKAVPMFSGKWRYLRQCFGDDIGRWISYFFPISVFHSSWSELDQESFMIDRNSALARYKNMGFSAFDTVTPVEINDSQEFVQKNLSESAMETLRGITLLCKENDIQLILYTAPYAKDYNYHDILTSFAHDNNAVYIDFFDLLQETGIDGKSDFQDVGHLNRNGSIKMAHYFGKYLTDNYPLTDMRTINDNPWDIVLRDNK